MGRKPPHFRDFPETLRCPYGPYMAVVEHHVDGDTFDATWDVGASEYPYRVCRFLGVNAPEKNRPATREAGQAAWRYLIDLMPVGTPLRLITRPDPDAFGRFLVKAEMQDGTDVGSAMVAAGHAVEWER